MIAEASPSFSLRIDDLDEFFDGGCRFLQGGIFVRCQRDLHDLLQPFRAELSRHANEQVADAVPSLEKDGTRQNLPLVLEHRLHHLGDS